MKTLIDKATVRLLINHRIELLQGEARLGNCHRAVVHGKIAVLEEVRNQLDFIVPAQVDQDVIEAIILPS